MWVQGTVRLSDKPCFIVRFSHYLYPPPLPFNFMWHFMSNKVIFSVINCYGCPGSEASTAFEWKVYANSQGKAKSNDNAGGTKNTAL